MSWPYGGGSAVRGAREAFRPSAIFLCLVALFVTSGWMAWAGYGSARFNVFVFVVSGWLVSLCLHEYAHALAAYLSGDRSTAERGYLTLNPLKYSHPLLSIVFPVVIVLLGGIGLPGGAVWVDHHAIPGRVRHTVVSAAGPATNVAFTLVLVALIPAGADVVAHLEFWVAVAFLAFLQLTASVLNFLPIPGVDGGNALHPWLSPEWRRGYDLAAPYGMLVLFALLWNDRIGGYFFDAVFWLGDRLGLPRELYALGFDMIRFWQG
ncbi:MAG: site-2 protease family protein [Micromonosporaceae bacterium]|nr:site-2 protease family protein [Micromonosporaceae bacterium]